MQTSEDNTTGFYINFVTIFLLVNGNYFFFFPVSLRAVSELKVHLKKKNKKTQLLSLLMINKKIQRMRAGLCS